MRGEDGSCEGCVGSLLLGGGGEGLMFNQPITIIMQINNYLQAALDRNGIVRHMATFEA